MKLTVLGCHGGESPHHRLTTFPIDGRNSIDSGALCRGLELDEQCKIDHIIISHTHLDHIRDLASLSDNVIGIRTKPVTIWCTKKTVETLTAHFFNNLIWPDFTKIKIPGTELPVIEYKIFEAEKPFIVGPYAVRAIEVKHPVESMAMLFSWTKDGKRNVLGYSSDTGPTDRFWQVVSATKDLKALLCECSFPNEMQWLADVSGHLSPKTMAESIAKANLGDGVPILLYHGKPSHLHVLQEQISALADSRMTMLKVHVEFILE